jgi:ABC-type polysaccharide/polyol phosphate export permease
MTIVFTVVFSKVLGAGSDPIGYAASVLTGMALWAFLRDCTLVGCRCFQTNEAYIRQSPIPYTVYTLRTALGQAIHSVLALGVVVCMVAAYQGDPTVLLRVFFMIPGLVLLFLAAWAASTITAFVTVFFHDTQHLLEVGAQIVFFLTPIMYPRALLDDKQLGWIVDANPVYWLLELTRGPLLTGHLPTWQMYLSGAGVTLALVGLAAGVVAWLQKRVIFVL